MRFCALLFVIIFAACGSKKSDDSSPVPVPDIASLDTPDPSCFVSLGDAEVSFNATATRDDSAWVYIAKINEASDYPKTCDDGDITATEPFGIFLIDKLKCSTKYYMRVCMMNKASEKYSDGKTVAFEIPAS